jgi:hypothetical protein
MVGGAGERPAKAPSPALYLLFPVATPRREHSYSSRRVLNTQNIDTSDATGRLLFNLGFQERAPENLR